MQRYAWHGVYCALVSVCFYLYHDSANADSFTIVDGQVITTTQTLNDNETGEIESGGQLNTTGNNNHGIDAPGDNVNINNAGSISTTGDDADGIFSDGINATITNSGKISTTGDDAWGIHVEGDQSTISNSGSISTTGDDSYGIISEAANGLITNNGQIINQGDFGIGIVADGLNNTTINNGLIKTTGNPSGGIGVMDLNNANTINNGTIIVEGGNVSFGIDTLALNDNNTVNNGSITVNGDISVGIESSAFNNNNTINNGSITVNGDISVGIESFAFANNTTTNSGSIIVNGDNSAGIFADGLNSNIINNSGDVFVTGMGSFSIVTDIGDDTLNLLSGSRIIGTIDLGGGTDTVNISGANTSAVMTLTNVETINSSVPGVVNGNVVTTVDPTGQSVQGVALSNFTSAIHNVISQRMVQTPALAPLQLASLELSPGMLFQERQPIVWGEVFGSRRDRGDDGLVLEHTHDYKGFTGGYERDYNKARIGLMAGFADSNIATDVSSIETDTDSFFAGAYGHWYLGKVNLTTTLVGGAEDHDNDRLVVDNLNGIETARSDFSSVFLSPSVTLSSAYTINEHFEFRPSATLTYNVAWYDDYTEAGTTRSNLTIDDHTVQSLHGRVQLAVAMALNDMSEFELRTGFTTRHTDDDDVDANLAGTNFSYAAAGDDSVQGGFVGGNLRFHTTDRLDVLADIVYHGASGDEDEISARLQFEYRF
jgi:uncharacterized protein YhjY with autotransporter beta-barrel domain